MTTQLTGTQLTHIAAKTNARGAEFEHPYTFVLARVNNADTVLQITVNVITTGMQEIGRDRLIKGFWASFPEYVYVGSNLVLNNVDIPAVNGTIDATLDDVEKRINMDMRNA